MPKKLTNEEFQERLKKHYGDTLINLQPYKNKRSKIQMKCNVCEYIWDDSYAESFSDGEIKGCPNCASGGKLAERVAREGKCLNCGKELDSRIKKFCNRSCSATYNNKLRTITKKPKEKKEPENVKVAQKKPLKQKICSMCGNVFESNNNGGRKYCYECSPVLSKKDNTSVKQHKTFLRQAMKRQSINLLGGACSICGYNKCVDALEFHHTDPNEKEMHLSNGNTRSWEKHKKELSKCILLCSNCHRELHAKIRI